jgi:hypothetical protein
MGGGGVVNDENEMVGQIAQERLRIFEPGDGCVLYVGWTAADQYGTAGFRAIVEFPQGPPEGLTLRFEREFGKV